MPSAHRGEFHSFKPAFCYREQGKSQAGTLHINLALGSWLVRCSRWPSVALINTGQPTWEESVYSYLHFQVIVYHSGKSGQEFKQEQRQKPQRKLLPGPCSVCFHVSAWGSTGCLEGGPSTSIRKTTKDRTTHQPDREESSIPLLRSLLPGCL